MDIDEQWQVITEQRRLLADLLDGLDAGQWEAPSLCDAWRVRDVAAHLSMVPKPPSAALLVRHGVAARGNFNRLNRDIAIAHAARPTAQIVADVRDHAASRKVPVVTSPRNVLFDLLTHIQDIARPLDLEVPAPVAAYQSAAERVWAMGWPFHARRLIAGHRLVAVDSTFAVGEGTVVTGPTAALLLALTGRPAALRDLDGPGAAALAARLAPSSPSHRVQG